MGQFEKIVVLIAFLLVTVILVVTFSAPEDRDSTLTMGGGDEVLAQGVGTQTSGEFGGDGLRAKGSGEGENPRRRTDGPEGPGLAADGESEVGSGDSAPRVGDGATPETDNLGGRGLEQLTRAEDAGDLFLDDAFTARALERGEIPEGSALVTLEGLERTFDSSIMEYAWQRGDNWVQIAERLYGDRSMSALLRQFNEGATYRAPGETILVPVFDGRDQVAERGEEAKAAAAGELSVERGNLYRVEDGDSLWVISKKVYGKGSLWEKIYEANRDQLKSPDSVKPGMGLRIP